MRTMARAVGVVVGVAAAFGATTVLAAATVNPLAERCDLFKLKGLEDPSSAACMRCHDGSFASSGTNHPVDMDYASAAARRAGGMMRLRAPSDVVARGVFLPDGKVTCVTCHDGRSPWKYALAMPAGARPSPAVNPRDRSTYADPARRGAREAEIRDAELSGTYGVRVTPTPLCKACHALD